MFDGVAGGDSRRDAKLTVDGSEMPVDGTGADDEPLSRLCIRQALSHQPQDIYLSLGQSSRVGGCCLYERWFCLSRCRCKS